MCMKYNFGKILLIGSSSVLLLEAAVCIIRKLNICLLSGKNDCMFCKKEKRNILMKRGSNNSIQSAPAKSNSNFTVISCLLKTMISVLKTPEKPKIPQSNYVELCSEIATKTTENEANNKIGNIIHKVSIISDNSVYMNQRYFPARYSR